ncbi:MAG: hypothetical protein EZS28_008055, partial [Streblomastix strix]
MPLPEFWLTNAVPDLTNLVPSYPITEPVLTNGEPTVNTNMRTSTIKQLNHKRVTKFKLNKSIDGSGCSMNNREIKTEYNVSQKQRNQQQRQSQRSISPTHKRADESEDDEFLDEIIPEQQCHIYHHTKLTQKQHKEHGKTEDMIQQEIQCDQIQELEM